MVRGTFVFPTLFALFSLGLSQGIENCEVLVFQDEYALVCENNNTMDVEWSYRKEENGTAVPIGNLSDTSYIVIEDTLTITNIKADHEGYYSCNQSGTLYHLIVYAVPGFMGCSIEPDLICPSDEVTHVTEGDNITFSISVVYFPGGPSGMEQTIGRISLEKHILEYFPYMYITLVNCSNDDLNTCIINQNSDVSERLTYNGNGNDPWFDIEINITNAKISDNGSYLVVLEAQDLINPALTITRNSEVIVQVTPTTPIHKYMVSKTSGTSIMRTALLGEPSTSPTISPEASNSSNISAAGFVSVLLALILLLLM